MSSATRTCFQKLPFPTTILLNLFQRITRLSAYLSHAWRGLKISKSSYHSFKCLVLKLEKYLSRLKLVGFVTLIFIL
ncbi:hypothetical protein OIU74_024370 [Salix koriyanagi]|uniref:Uncharacterized protein n=1 Tax=Salix koriyanagi TaxID=2511006 RepID=A0A9Q0W6Z8_9ROSI|nr:hypothetical protein OIU74_024370 [Salix koriyanagi]